MALLNDLLSSCSRLRPLSFVSTGLPWFMLLSDNLGLTQLVFLPVRILTLMLPMLTASTGSSVGLPVLFASTTRFSFGLRIMQVRRLRWSYVAVDARCVTVGSRWSAGCRRVLRACDLSVRCAWEGLSGGHVARSLVLHVGCLNRIW